MVMETAGSKVSLAASLGGLFLIYGLIRSVAAQQVGSEPVGVVLGALAVGVTVLLAARSPG